LPRRTAWGCSPEALKEVVQDDRETTDGVWHLKQIGNRSGSPAESKFSEALELASDTSEEALIELAPITERDC
jgi:hypothetical protein